LLFWKILYAFDFSGISTDLNSVFTKAKTEEGKKDINPVYQGTNVPETKVNDSNINNGADNEVTNFVKETINTREMYNMRQIGNIVDNTKEITDNNQNIVNKSYGDCKNNIEYKICYKYYGNNTCPDQQYIRTCNLIPFIYCKDFFSKLEENVKISINVNKGTYTYTDGIFKIKSLNYNAIDFTITINNQYYRC
jgi:hypothetical protein